MAVLKIRNTKIDTDCWLALCQSRKDEPFIVMLTVLVKERI